MKLRTHVGEPIPYDQNLSPEDLQEKVSSNDVSKRRELIQNSEAKRPVGVSTLFQRYLHCSESYVAAPTPTILILGSQI